MLKTAKKSRKKNTCLLPKSNAKEASPDCENSKVPNTGRTNSLRFCHRASNGQTSLLSSPKPSLGLTCQMSGQSSRRRQKGSNGAGSPTIATSQSTRCGAPTTSATMTPSKAVLAIAGSWLRRALLPKTPTALRTSSGCKN